MKFNKKKLGLWTAVSFNLKKREFELAVYQFIMILFLHNIPLQCFVATWQTTSCTGIDLRFVYVVSTLRLVDTEGRAAKAAQRIFNAVRRRVLVPVQTARLSWAARAAKEAGHLALLWTCLHHVALFVHPCHRSHLRRSRAISGSAQCLHQRHRCMVF